MKYFDPFEQDWQNQKVTPKNKEEAERLARYRSRSVVHQDEQQMSRLVQLLMKYPHDIFLVALPSEYDTEFAAPGHHVGEPPTAVRNNPAAFVSFTIPPWFYSEDYAMEVGFEPMRVGEPYDSFEQYFIRKSKPKLVKTVHEILQRHLHLHRMWLNAHHYWYAQNAHRLYPPLESDETKRAKRVRVG